MCSTCIRRDILWKRTMVALLMKSQRHPQIKRRRRKNVTPPKMCDHSFSTFLLVSVNCVPCAYMYLHEDTCSESWCSVESYLFFVFCFLVLSMTIICCSVLCCYPFWIMMMKMSEYDMWLASREQT